jgi:hypothetical protein
MQQNPQQYSKGQKAANLGWSVTKALVYRPAANVEGRMLQVASPKLQLRG